MKYFCRGKMTEAHAHDVCFSNHTIAPDEKAGLLPRNVSILYDERCKIIDWVLEKLEIRIWIYSGGKIYILKVIDRTSFGEIQRMLW